jgi:hypothetical protein
MGWAVAGQDEGSPSTTLGEHPELQNFSYSISYFEGEELERTYLPLEILEASLVIIEESSTIL